MRNQRQGGHKRRMRILLLNQTFYPDVVATAQYLKDVAVALRDAGHSVTILASRRGYDAPEVLYPAREIWNGIEIRRVYSSGFGKRAKWTRFVDFLSFWFNACVGLFTLPRFDVVVSLTSPPLIGALAALFVQLRGGRLVLWIMDLNPDEALVAGWLRQNSLSARFLQRAAVFSMRSADDIVVLDRFMAARVSAKGPFAEKIKIIPPWPLDDDVAFDQSGRNRFRTSNGLDNKFVVMYSGNHSPCHPMDTVLEAAAQLQGRQDIVFCFVGGGSEFQKVKRFAAERSLPNFLCLPYRPLNELSGSLSAADLHLVVMGEPFAGIKHPCKIYNVLSLGSDFLFVGSAENHVTDLGSRNGSGSIGRYARHGDVDGVVRHILESVAQPVRSRRSHLPAGLAKSELLPKLVNLIAPGESVSASR
jgi:glycosyltransferase involved in cell wall biosynthesis